MNIFKRTNKNLQKPEEFTNSPPTNGGNLFQVEQDLKARIKLLEATIPTISTPKSIFTKSNYDLYRLMIFQANYFVNIFNFSTNNPKLNKQIRLLKRISFLYGRAAIYKLGENYTAYFIKEIVLTNSGDIDKIALIPAHLILSQQSIELKNDNLLTINLSSKDLKNVVILQWDDSAFGAWFTLLPFLQQEEEILKIYNIYSFSYIKKYVHNVEDISSANSELESYFNTDSPFVRKIGTDFSIGNKISNLDLGSQNNPTNFIDWLEKWYSIYYDKIGRRYNSDDKKERNVTTEVEASQNNFKILESENKFYINQFCEELNKKFGLKIEKEWEEEMVDKEMKEEENNEL